MRTRLILLMVPILMASDDGPLAGRVAGEPVDCISDAETRSQAQIVDGSTIAYSRTAKRTWITHPEGSCATLRPFQALVVERRGVQLCRGDRFRTVRGPGSTPSGICRFGRFTPYDKAPSSPGAR